ncbi:MAG TPA: MiaB/RimO family radical SAM methylthiotransferase, partial [Clostridia bacterium]|nr:MiaB/RimO family radical SAM methylthiotransferase [Clostridia bacterium]
MGKYKIVNYGCQMNVHESEKVAGMLDKLGFVATDNMIEADIVAFNTCCIRDTAEQRAFGNIGVVKHQKKKNPELIVIVVGCMTQQDGYLDIFKQKYPYVDIVLGTKNINLLPNLILENLEKKTKFRSNNQPDNYLEIDETTPVTRTSFPNAWVNIMYGCNNFCTYCIVPYVRGREISRDMTSIINEIKTCLNEGYKEITLLGQNVNSYGNDRSDGASFARLLSEIDKIEGKFRVRFMTSHPKDLNEEIVDIIAESEKICK